MGQLTGLDTFGHVVRRKNGRPLRFPTERGACRFGISPLLRNVIFAPGKTGVHVGVQNDVGTANPCLAR